LYVLFDIANYLKKLTFNLFVGLLSFHFIINNIKENLLFNFILFLYVTNMSYTNICDTKSINDKNMDIVIM